MYLYVLGLIRRIKNLGLYLYRNYDLGCVCKLYEDGDPKAVREFASALADAIRDYCLNKQELSDEDLDGLVVALCVVGRKWLCPDASLRQSIVDHLGVLDDLRVIYQKVLKQVEEKLLDEQDECKRKILAALALLGLYLFHTLRSVDGAIRQAVMALNNWKALFCFIAMVFTKSLLKPEQEEHSDHTLPNPTA